MHTRGPKNVERGLGGGGGAGGGGNGFISKRNVEAKFKRF